MIKKIGCSLIIFLAYTTCLASNEFVYNEMIIPLHKKVDSLEEALTKKVDKLCQEITDLKAQLDETKVQLAEKSARDISIINDLQNNIFEEIKKIPDFKQLEDYINAQVDAQIDSLKLEMKRDLLRTLRLQLIQDGKDAEAKTDNPKPTTKDEL